MRTTVTPVYGLQASGHSHAKFIVREDFTLPIAAKQPERTIAATLENRAWMQVRNVVGRRVMLRFAVEVNTKDGGSMTYKRMRQRHVILSIGTPEEAERAVDAILSFAMSLDGKHLVDQQDTHSQGISSESAPNP